MPWEFRNAFWILICFSLLPVTKGSAQTELEGVVNAYASISDINDCLGILTVDSTRGFAADQQVIVIQMQGAVINESNTPDFGLIDDSRSAGAFELATIDSIAGNRIFLRLKLLNQYNLDGQVQLVSFERYDDVVVTDTVFAKSWDGKTGGVVALNVRNRLELEAPIIASGRGFRGGRSISLPNGCTGGFNNAGDYFYPIDDWRGAEKGEGIAAYITGKENGRGPQANGGGGGNDHNSGGAGGANVSDGGRGGERDSPFLTGDCKGENPGIGGRALLAVPPRIYLGGGGGAGHGNNDVGTNGGHGGGIVIVSARRIAGSVPEIRADGLSALSATAGDGAGGGGAGGSVLLDVNNVDIPLIVSASGGNGGHVNNSGDDTCFGPGGGGSGGRLLTNLPQALLNQELAGGLAGQTTNSSSACNNSNNGAEAGAEGEKDFLAGIPRGTTPIIPPSITQDPAAQLEVCDGGTADLQAFATGNSVTYQWQINRGTGFVNLFDDAFHSGSFSNRLRITGDPSLEGNLYRLVITDFCGRSDTSSASGIRIDPVAAADFNFLINGREVTFLDQSNNALNWEWDFSDGNSSSTPNPVHTFDTDGTYSVSLTVSNSCGDSTLTRVITIATAPMAGFTASVRNSCTPFTVQFSESASSNTTDYEWFFEGGNPASSLQPNPEVIYSAAGTFDVQLIVRNSSGSDTLYFADHITARSAPIADFSFNVIGQEVFFTNTSQFASNFTWAFGDGSGSTAADPSHDYGANGTWQVTLLVENECGRDTLTRILETGSAPNPLFIASNNRGCASLEVQFFDQTAGPVNSRSWEFPGGSPSTSSLPDPIVTYSSPGWYDVRLTATNDIGTNTLDLVAYVQVLERPTADFSYSANGRLVAFSNNSQNADRYSWDFGDGSPLSTMTNPVHQYPANGLYFVTLNALNNYCGSSITYGIGIDLTGIKEAMDGEQAGIRLFPNPTRGILSWEPVGYPLPEPVLVRLFSPTGLECRTWNGQERIDLFGLASGLYFLEISWPGGSALKKVIKYD